MIHNSPNGLSIVISGSFRKHYDDIREAIRRFEGLGMQVLSPEHSEVVNPGNDFVLLETDGGFIDLFVDRAAPATGLNARRIIMVRVPILSSVGSPK